MSETNFTKGRALAVWRAYYAHARRYPGAFALLVLGDVGMQAAELASPIVLRRLFNLLSTQPRVEASVSAMVSNMRHPGGTMGTNFKPAPSAVRVNSL